MAEPTIRAVERTLAIIKYLAEEHRPLSIGEISRATTLAPATVHRVLGTLMKDDWVEQNARTSRYRLGFGLLGTAAATMVSTPLVDKARMTLVRVSAMSELHSWLGVLVGMRIAYLAEAEGKSGKYAPFQPGISHHAHAICGGKVLLAAVSEDERKRLYRGQRELHRYTANTIVTPAALEREFEEVRARGYAIDRAELSDSWYGVAVPVRGTDGRVIATLITGGIDVPIARLESFVPELRFLSQDLSLELGRDD